MTWQHAEAIAQILSAFGTVAAVIVALYLARHQSAIHLRVQTQVEMPGPPSIVRNVPHGDLIIRIANVGYRDVTVERIGWDVGLPRRHFIDDALFNSRRISQSDAAIIPIYLPNWQAREWLVDALGGSRFARIFRSRSLRLTVALSTGETLPFRVSRSVRRFLLREVARVKGANVAHGNLTGELPAHE